MGRWSLVVALLAIGLLLTVPPAGLTVLGAGETGGSTVAERRSSVRPSGSNFVTIEGAGIYKFDCAKVETCRPEIFAEYGFSVFDAVRYVAEKYGLALKYHFAPELDTQVIDSLQGKAGWWYYAHYDGGNKESNALRMDYFPYKNKMTICLFPLEPGKLGKILDTFRREVARWNGNKGQVIVPRVTIEGLTTRLDFRDVPVRPHDLRPDLFRPGVLTVADVILSLGDQGKLTYDLAWYETIGRAEVKAYFFERFQKDKASGRAGFAYESGDNAFAGTWFNRFHITADCKVIKSPEYVKFFWLDLSGGKDPRE